MTIRHIKDTRLLVDGLHTGEDDGFSLMPPKLLTQLHNNTGLFRHINAYLFTHLHSDHYDQQFLETALDHSICQPKVFGPELSLSTIKPYALQEKIGCFRVKDVSVYTLKTEHIGKQYVDVPHCSILLATGNESYFIAGDGILIPKYGSFLVKNINSNVRTVFVNVYQLSSKESIEFIRRLAPSRIFLYHFPFPEDDSHHYLKLQTRVIKNCPKDLPTPIMPRHMHWLNV